MGTLSVVSSVMIAPIQVITGDGVCSDHDHTNYPVTHYFPLQEYVWFPYHRKNEQFIVPVLGQVPYGMARLAELVIWEMQVSRE